MCPLLPPNEIFLGVRSGRTVTQRMAATDDSSYSSTFGDQQSVLEGTGTSAKVDSGVTGDVTFAVRDISSVSLLCLLNILADISFVPPDISPALTK